MAPSLTVRTLSLSLLAMVIVDVQIFTPLGLTSAMSIGSASGSGPTLLAGTLPPLFLPLDSTTPATNPTNKCVKSELELFCQVCPTRQCSIVDTERCYWKCLDTLDKAFVGNIPNLLDTSPITLF